jgi:hypothetical protein
MNTEMQIAFITGLAVMALFWWYVSQNHSRAKKDQYVMLHPMEANVMVQCKVCRGRGRRGIAVDPREFTRHEDKKLKMEDFPICEECEGRGSVFLLSVKLQPMIGYSAVGTPSPATQDSLDQPCGASILAEDFPLKSSAPEPVPTGTSSTPPSPILTHSRSADPMSEQQNPIS